jgi:response regulator RpfG family c-di-GMP phosphodiesterase
LKNNEIPLGSQILQVADSVSSMATSRSYQNKKSFDLILAELEMYKGTQFNPVICEHMIDLIKSGIIQNYFKSKK